MLVSLFSSNLVPSWQNFRFTYPFLRGNGENRSGRMHFSPKTGCWAYVRRKNRHEPLIFRVNRTRIIREAEILPRSWHPGSFESPSESRLQIVPSYLACGLLLLVQVELFPAPTTAWVERFPLLPFPGPSQSVSLLAKFTRPITAGLSRHE